MKFNVKRKDIRAMLHLTAKKDIRYYLQGIHVVQDNRGTYLEATDGHIMGRLLINSESHSEKKSIVLPSEQLLKLKGTKKTSDDYLHFTVNGLAVECIDGNQISRFEAHDARFPDTDRVLPLVFKSEEIAVSTFNIDLLSRFVDASEEIWGKRQVPQVMHRGNSSGIVSFSHMDDCFVGVIMPMREQGASKVPEWCYLPSVKPVENSDETYNADGVNTKNSFNTAPESV
jgi:hypothetical protein